MVSQGTFSQLGLELGYFDIINSIFSPDATPEQKYKALSDIHGKIERKFFSRRRGKDLVTNSDYSMRAAIVCSTYLDKSKSYEAASRALNCSRPTITRWTADEIKRNIIRAPGSISDEKIISAVNHVRTWRDLAGMLKCTEKYIAKRVRKMIAGGNCPLVIEKIPRMNKRSGTGRNGAYKILGPLSGYREPSVFVLNLNAPATFYEMLSMYMYSICEGGPITSTKRKVLSHKLKNIHVFPQLKKWYSNPKLATDLSEIDLSEFGFIKNDFSENEKPEESTD